MDDHTKSHLHESPKSMTVPLMALGVLSVIGGFIGIPHIFGVTNYFEHWLEPVMASTSHGGAEHALAAGGGDTGTEFLLMGISVVLAVVGFFVARLFYNKKPELATSLREKMSGLHQLLLNKYYVDEIYGAIIVRPLVYFSLFLWKVVDVVFIDGFINGLATLYDGISETLRRVQSGLLRGYATAFVLGVIVLIAYFVVR